MSEINEVKDLFSDTQKTVTALRADVEALKGKQADYVDLDRQEKMKAELADQFAAEQKAMAERVAALETASNRPGAPGASDGESKHAQLFNGYLRKGSEPDEFKAMATSPQADGGFVVPDVMEAGIRERLRRTSPIRQIANVVAFEGGSYDILIERDDAGYEWGGETQSRSETDTPTINRISISLHELSAMPKLSQRVLDNASFDVGGWVVGYVADRFARAEASAFVNGDGVDKPKGFMSYSTSKAADDSRAVETLQYRATGKSAGFNATNPADVIVKTFYDLQGAYQANATWVAKNTTAAEIAVLKDGDGAYLMREMLNASGVIARTVQGRPLMVADDMPAIGANSFSIAVGDFSRGYTIIDNGTVTVLRDPFSAKPHVLFYTTKRVGGGLVESDAIKLIKFGTS